MLRRGTCWLMAPAARCGSTVPASRADTGVCRSSRRKRFVLAFLLQSRALPLLLPPCDLRVGAMQLWLLLQVLLPLAAVLPMTSNPVFLTGTSCAQATSV